VADQSLDLTTTFGPCPSARDKKEKKKGREGDEESSLEGKTSAKTAHLLLFAARLDVEGKRKRKKKRGRERE